MTWIAVIRKCLLFNYVNVNLVDSTYIFNNYRINSIDDLFCCFFFFRLEIWVESVIQLQWCKMTCLWMRGSEKKNVSVYSNIAEIVILKTMLKCHKRMCNMILKFTTIDQTNVYLGISSILRIKRIGVLGWCDFVVLSNEQSNNGYRT